jgi:hypothetical protein
MFISRAEAEARLRRQENILRDDVVERAPEATPVEIESDKPSAAEDELDNLLDNAMGVSGLRGPGHIRGQKNTAHFAGRISEQKAIADVAIIAGDSVAKEMFGISVQQANAYEKGLRSSDSLQGLVGDGELLSHVTRTKEAIRRLAAKKLEQTLDHLTDDKIESTTRATDIGRLAKDLASVHDKMERKETAEAGVQFHVFVPEVKQITNYNVIRISSEPRQKDSEQI